MHTRCLATTVHQTVKTSIPVFTTTLTRDLTTTFHQTSITPFCTADIVAIFFSFSSRYPRHLRPSAFIQDVENCFFISHWPHWQKNKIVQGLQQSNDTRCQRDLHVQRQPFNSRAATKNDSCPENMKSSVTAQLKCGKFIKSVIAILHKT